VHDRLGGLANLPMDRGKREISERRSTRGVRGNWKVLGEIIKGSRGEGNHFGVYLFYRDCVGEEKQEAQREIVFWGGPSLPGIPPKVIIWWPSYIERKGGIIIHKVKKRTRSRVGEKGEQYVSRGRTLFSCGRTNAENFILLRRWLLSRQRRLLQKRESKTGFQQKSEEKVLHTKSATPSMQRPRCFHGANFHRNHDSN